MKLYQSLSYWTVDLDALSSEQIAVFEKAWKYYQTKPDWNAFGNFSNNLLKTLNMYGGNVTDLPIFNILHDLEMRLGIQQKHVRQNDYRSVLFGYIYDQHISYDDFAKKHKLDPKLCKDVFLKFRAHLSIEKLQEICEKEGLELLPRKPFDF